MDPFATLGLPKRYALDETELEQRYRELQRALHPDRHSAQPASVRRMSLLKAVEVNEAYRTLKDELKRADALLALRGRAGGAASHDAAADPELLMEVMELREALGDAKQARDLARVRILEQRVRSMQDATRHALSQAFEALSETDAASEEQLERLAAIVGRLKYYRRFMDEVAVIEEQALA